MYGPPGVAYVYLVYGMYDCLNIVTERAGSPAALLVRAIEPIEGIDAMRAERLVRASARRREWTLATEASEAARIRRLPQSRLASGPGLVAAAMGIDRSMTGLDLLDPASPLRLEPAPAAEPSPAVAATARLGIGYAGPPWTEVRWRFVIPDHPSVSGPSAARAG